MTQLADVETDFAGGRSVFGRVAVGLLVDELASLRAENARLQGEVERLRPIAEAAPWLLGAVDAVFDGEHLPDFVEVDLRERARDLRTALNPGLFAQRERLREAVRNRERESLEACAEADELRAEVARLTQADRERLDMLDLAVANAGDAWAAVEEWQKKYAATEAGWRQRGVLIDFYRGAFDRVLPTDDELSAIEEAADFVRHQEAYWGSIMAWRDRVIAVRAAQALESRNPAPAGEEAGE